MQPHKDIENSDVAFAENGVTFERWSNIRSSLLSRLLVNPRFPARPDVSTKIAQLVQPRNIANNFGARLTTYYVVSSHFKPSQHHCIILDFMSHSSMRGSDYILQENKIETRLFFRDFLGPLNGPKNSILN